MQNIQFNLNNFLLAITETLDFVEMDLLGITTHHSKRVAYIASKIAQSLNLSQEEIFDLIAYAVLHDNGLSKNSNLVITDRYEELIFEDKSIMKFQKVFKEHCIIGEENVKGFPFLTNQKNIIKYHHEFYDGSGIFGIKGDDIPILAQLIAFSDVIDGLFKLDKTHYQTKDKLREFVKKYTGTLFNKKIVDIFIDLSYHTSFWLDMQDDKVMVDYLLSVSPSVKFQYSYNKLLSLTKIFTKIIDTKSTFTANHSNGLVDKCSIMSDYYNFSKQEKFEMMIAASLHDLGKLAISNNILDKNGKLTDEEMDLMKSHVYYTKKALSNIEGFEYISKIAANHHEKLNGSGYPYGLKEEDLTFKEKLMGCLDIYQALTEDRPYRDGLGHTKTIEIMKDMVKNGEIDKNITDNLDNILNPNRNKTSA